MIILADRAEIFLNYLVNTRQSEDGKYSCICRNADGRKLDIRKTHNTADEALKHCRMAALQDSMKCCQSPQLLVKVGKIDRVVAANTPAEFLLGGKLAGHSYSWFFASDRQVLLENGICRSDVRCLDLDGKSACMGVSEQLIKLADVVLILATINPLN